MHKTSVTSSAPAEHHPANTIADEDLAPLTFGDRFLIALSQSCRHIALLAAAIATCGSLFMSEVLHWQPCLLCWYQRILMYPLTILISVGILRRDRRVHLYVLPMSLFGACISIYHYAVTKGLIPPPPCDAISGVSCVTGWLNWLGFINVPFLALIGFIIISLMMMVSATIVVEDDAEETEAGAATITTDSWFSPAVQVAAIIIGVVGAFVVATATR